MKPVRNSLALLVLPVLIFGCDSGGDSNALSDDSPLLSDDQSCPAPSFDVAELLFTESDRQWYCSVAGAGVQLEDEIYFARNGQAVTTRFREVYWNRSLADDSINVASPFISPFIISNMVSANTVLTFDLIKQTGEVEVYDCVLVGRETQAPELL